jgi:hypothetical protein
MSAPRKVRSAVPWQEAGEGDAVTPYRVPAADLSRPCLCGDASVPDRLYLGVWVCRRCGMECPA